MPAGTWRLTCGCLLVPRRRAGQAGSTTDEDFPGLAGLVRPDGSVAARLPDWREGVLTVDIPLPGRQLELHPGDLLG